MALIKVWIEAMRLRTLPVSIAGVLAGCGIALWHNQFALIPSLLCFLFAILSQIASNFANEYYDYKNGLDRKGREGFRRGVTEGDISPNAMKNATFITLGLAAIVGCIMLFYGDWWFILVGIFIGLFALAYSTGPYPLSHHGLGDLAVIIFFGIIPVSLTCYIQEKSWENFYDTFLISLSIGLLAANVLIVNNYRDMDDDKAVGKRTTVVIFGRKVMSRAYLLSGIIAMSLMTPIWDKLPNTALIIPIIYFCFHFIIWKQLRRKAGAALNPLLGKTAMNLLLFTLMLLVAFIFD